jgi:hypothetical protein
MDELWSNRYTAAGGWGDAIKVPSIATRVGGAPRMPPSIAMDGNGNAVALWIQGVADSSCTRVNIWANRFAVDQGWGTSQILDGPPGDCSSSNGFYTVGSIAMELNGNALAMWAKREVLHTNVWWTRYSQSAGWIAPTLLETYDVDWVTPTVITTDSAGHALAVLVEGNQTNQKMWSKRYSADAGWDPSARIQTDAAYVYDFRIASNTNNNVMAVWTNTDTPSVPSIWAIGF